MFDWLWRRIHAEVVTALKAEVVLPLIATEMRLTTAIGATERALRGRLDELVAGLHEAADQRAALMLARLDEADRRFDEALAHADAILAKVDLALTGIKLTTDAVAGSEDRLGARFDAAVAEGIATLGSGAGTMLGARLTALMGSPWWEAARYAVQKSDADRSLTDNAIRHQQALEWAKRWLREYGHPVPTDRTLNLLIELVLVERKGLEAVR